MAGASQQGWGESHLQSSTKLRKALKPAIGIRSTATMSPPITTAILSTGVQATKASERMDRKAA
ncbi:hypothetical protein [Novipirellula sp.]|uniref:hypothetical protein n=1 Tax=Novipirellula sp. TaxID=2795430 RepID=UPI003566A094